MNTTVHKLMQTLQTHSSTQMAGAVKTFPLRELFKNEQQLQEALLPHHQPLSSAQRRELQQAYDKLQDIITKRIEAAQMLIEKFANTSPEIIALNNSVFSLVPSRALLEDVRVAYGHSSSPLMKDLTAASTNVLEAVNIEIQQRFAELSPETIAVNYSGTELTSYRKLLKNLLTHIDVGSDIFKVYSKITRNVIEGDRIYESRVGLARKFCQEVFHQGKLDLERGFAIYTAEEIARYTAALESTARILDQDISGRPSLVEFSRQCRQILEALAENVSDRKTLMRRTSRVLQLSHYLSFLTTEEVSENATTILMICQRLFEEARAFLVDQQKQLDVSLNIKSLEDAQQKIQEGLRYRQFAIAQIFRDISKLSADDLAVVSEQCLGNSHLLLQEIQHLVEAYNRQAASHSAQIKVFSASLREIMKILHEAIATTRVVTAVEPKAEQIWELERPLPNLTKFYDKELMELIGKALEVNNSSSLVGTRALNELEASFAIPSQQLQTYLESFISLIEVEKSW